MRNAEGSSGLIIFDFDGVIAESEALVHRALAKLLTELGMPTTLEDSYKLSLGKRFVDAVASIEGFFGCALPATFARTFEARTTEIFRNELQLVAGAGTYIDTFAHVARCIASSSSPDRLALCIGVLKLQAVFGDHVFSATKVARGKPAPDIFLHAAARMGANPPQCIVLEDSPSGVEAARAAGMTVIGLLAGSHIQPDHGDRLRSSGAHHIAHTFEDAEIFTKQVLARMGSAKPQD